MCKRTVIVLLLWAWLGTAWGADVREIELRDGTVLRGEIVLLDDGTYTIRSESLGETRIAASEVRVIRFPAQGTGPAAVGDSAPAGARPESEEPGEPPRAGDVKREVEEIQRSLAGDGSLMDIITSLGDDPEVQAVLSDPRLMQAVQSGDLSTLMASPKFMDLLANPRIQEIQGRRDTRR
jgi:hypothetical protein